MTDVKIRDKAKVWLTQQQKVFSSSNAIIYRQERTDPTEENDKASFPVSLQTYWRINDVDNSGRAWALYSFYVLCCVNQDSSQPLATDEWCSERLHWQIKTLRKTRKILMGAGVVNHISKGKKGYRYIKVNYMNKRFTNGNAFELNETPLPEGVMGTESVLHHFNIWYTRMLKNYPVFEKRLLTEVKKRKIQVTGKLHENQVCSYLEKIFDRINNNGWGILSVDNEKAFVYYMISSLINEFLSRGIHSVNRSVKKRTI